MVSFRRSGETIHHRAHRDHRERVARARAYAATIDLLRVSFSSRKTFSGGMPISRQAAARLRRVSAVFSSKMRESTVLLFSSQNASSEARATRRLPPRKGR